MMSVQLGEEVIRLLHNEDTIKVLATTDEFGEPHATVKQNLHLGEDGNLLFLELLESSQNSKNLIRSLWFKRKVAITLKSKEGTAYQIKGTPVKSIVNGPVFQQYYVNIRKKKQDADLAAVWVVEPESVENLTYFVNKAKEEAERPYFQHLDRLRKD